MRITVTGAATPDEVWHRYVTPGLWSTWSPQLRRVDCTEETIRPGSTGTAHGPAPIRVAFAVVGVDEGARTWSWRVGKPIGITMVHGVDEVDGGAAAWVEIPLLLAAYAPIARLALRRLVRP